MTDQTFTRVAEGVVQRGPRQFLARTWRGGPTKTFPTKALAVAWRRDRMARRDKGEPVVVRRSTVTVADECDVWLKANRRQLSPATFAAYERRLRCQVRHPDHGLGAVRLGALSWEAVEAWAVALETAGVAARTINQARSTLSLVCDGAMRATPPRLAVNPVRLARPLPMPRAATVTAPDRAAVFALIDALPAQHRIIAELALGAGLRIGEALALRPCDVDAEALEVHVRGQLTGRGYTPPKGGKVRLVPVQASLVALLRRHERDYRLDADGTYAVIKARRWSTVWAEARERAGVELEGVHQLRHAFGSYHIAAGETVANVSAWMGHADIATTFGFYVHAMPNARPATDLLARPGRKSRTIRALTLVGGD